MQFATRTAVDVYVYIHANYLLGCICTRKLVPSQLNKLGGGISSINIHTNCHCYSTFQSNRARRLLLYLQKELCLSHSNLLVSRRTILALKLNIDCTTQQNLFCSKFSTRFSFFCALEVWSIFPSRVASRRYTTANCDQSCLVWVFWGTSTLAMSGSVTSSHCFHEPIRCCHPCQCPPAQLLNRWSGLGQGRSHQPTFHFFSSSCIEEYETEDHLTVIGRIS